MSKFSSFLRLSNIPLCEQTMFCLLIISGHLGGCHILAIVDSTLMKVGVQTSLQDLSFISSGHISRNGIAGSYGFLFLRNWSTVISLFHISTNSVPGVPVSIFMRSSMSHFSLVSCAFALLANKLPPNSVLWHFYPMFSSKNVIILPLAVRSLVSIELIFLYGVREESNFILLHEDI